MRQLFLWILFAVMLYAQKFSSTTTTKESYLNFYDSKQSSQYVYNDDGSLLAWLNLPMLQSFRTQSDAQAYCQSLKLGNLQWRLPSSYQLALLPLFSPIYFGHRKKYIAGDKPVWDNSRFYGYDAKRKKIFSFTDSNATLYARCVSPLEE